MNKYGEKQIPAVRFHGNDGHLRFMALTKVHNRYFECSEMLHTHRRRISKETCMSGFTFVEYYILNKFVCVCLCVRACVRVCVKEKIDNI